MPLCDANAGAEVLQVVGTGCFDRLFRWFRGNGATLHYRTLAAATVLVVLLAGLSVAGGVAATTARRHVPVVFPDLAYNVEEGVVNVLAGPGGGLDELASETTRELLAICVMC